MKWLLHRWIYLEMIGPWILGVALFTVLLVAGTYLFRLTDLVVKGIEVTTVVTLSIYYLPALVVKTFPMAGLLAGMLAFGRLSNDSEVVAAMAGGASFFDLMKPVAVFGLVISALSFVINDFVVPRASIEASLLQDKITRRLRQTSGNPHHQPVFINGKMRGQIVARDVSIDTGMMYDVLIEWYTPDNNPDWILVAEQMLYTPEKEWKIRKGRVLYFDRQGGVTISRFETANPPKGTRFEFTPRDVFTLRNRDPDALSMRELGAEIVRLKEKKLAPESKIRDLEVDYWTKISFPLSGVIFALVGAPAAVRRTRQSFGVGVAASTAIIFGYYMLYNYLTIIAKGGLISPVTSAFLPVVIGTIVAAMLIWSKNR
ncbi:MAG TPA: LptF/LptG family permease [Fimbriimonadales bacterium]|nr:LptF/LptG family permease [Fimbriimonadales bacterium]